MSGWLGAGLRLTLCRRSGTARTARKVSHIGRDDEPAARHLVADEFASDVFALRNAVHFRGDLAATCRLQLGHGRSSMLLCRTLRIGMGLIKGGERIATKVVRHPDRSPG
jgi:hypothetical protein